VPAAAFFDLDRTLIRRSSALALASRFRQRGLITRRDLVPFLEAVGHPVAANPDRRLRRIAEERGWPVLRFAA